MGSTVHSKTLTATLNQSPVRVYDYVANLENLPHWHNAFCRSVRPSAAGWTVETPRGTAAVRMIRDDRARLADLVMVAPDGAEMTAAMRVLANGEGAELVL